MRTAVLLLLALVPGQPAEVAVAPAPVAQVAAPKAVILAPAQVAPGDLAVLDGSTSTGTGHCWRLVGSPKTFLAVNGGTQCVFASGTPGVFSFVLGVAVEGKCDVAVFDLVVTGGTPVPPTPPGPGPGPGPGPNPPQPPGPKPAHAWAVVVEETAQRTPATARVLNDLAAWEQLTTAGHHYRIYDKDNPAAAAYVKAVADRATGLPALLILDDRGKVLDCLPLPATSAGVADAIKRVTAP